MVTQRDIAESLGVSVAAVSSAFRNPGRIGAALRESIYETASRLGYRYQQLAFTSIGVLVEEPSFFTDLYFADIFRGIVSECINNGLAVRYFHQLPEKYSEIYSIGGFIAIDRLSPVHKRRLTEFNKPYLVAGCVKSSAYVAPNRPKGVALLIEYLRHLGHRRFAVLTGTDPLTDIEESFSDIVKSELAKYKYDEVMGCQVDFANLDTIEVALAQLMTYPNPPTALLCENDVLAFSTILRLKKMDTMFPKTYR